MYCAVRTAFDISYYSSLTESKTQKKKEEEEWNSFSVEIIYRKTTQYSEHRHVEQFGTKHPRARIGGRED